MKSLLLTLSLATVTVAFTASRAAADDVPDPPAEEREEQAGGGGGCAATPGALGDEALGLSLGALVALGVGLRRRR